MPLVRLRKMVAFERFLARLMVNQAGDWLLKGGLALQWRLGNVARTTRDLDMLLTVPAQDIHASLVRAALLDLGDWFRFLVRQPTISPNPGGGQRFMVQTLLDGRPFEAFHLDVGWGDPVLEPAEMLSAPPLLGFADIEPSTILCYPVTQHIAEKVHAYTRIHLSGESSRVKDLVDILLLARMARPKGPVLSEALRLTFEARNTHPLPLTLSSPPANWALPFRRMAREVKLEWDDLAQAVEQARRFLEPVLSGQAQGVWDPLTWQWPGTPPPVD
jgi:hypothetical protein